MLSTADRSSERKTSELTFIGTLCWSGGSESLISGFKRKWGMNSCSIQVYVTLCRDFTINREDKAATRGERYNNIKRVLLLFFNRRNNSMLYTDRMVQQGGKN